MPASRGNNHEAILKKDEVALARQDTKKGQSDRAGESLFFMTEGRIAELREDENSNFYSALNVDDKDEISKEYNTIDTPAPIEPPAYSDPNIRFKEILKSKKELAK